MTERTRRGADGPLVALLAQGTPIREAAERAHVSPSTVTRRLREPPFRARVDEARRQVWDEALGKASAACTAALTTLVDLLAVETPPAVRLGAAKSILELVQHGIEQAQLEQRVAVLEAEVAATRKGGPRVA